MNPYIPEKLPLAGRINWENLVRQIGRSCYALAKYDGILQGIVNPLLLLSPLSTKEAVISSKIEGTQATLEDVLEFEASVKSNEVNHVDIQEIINYRQSVTFAVQEINKKPINLNLLKRVHFGLMDSVRGKDKARGEFRTIQNWIGPYKAPLEKATFVPPPPDLVMPAMSNLEYYIHYEEKDRLVQLAIIHAQFEMIHPFLDGNGRVGRMLIPLFLFDKGLLTNPVFYISSYLDDNRSIYYSKLNNISKNADWDSWISFFLEVVEIQAKTNTAIVQSILNLYGEMKDKIVDYTRSPLAIRALDAIFERPLFTTTNFIKSSGIPKPSAMRMLSKLKKEKELVTIKKGQGRLPELLAFMKLMDIINS